jgi:hypothetical protein
MREQVLVLSDVSLTVQAQAADGLRDGQLVVGQLDPTKLAESVVLFDVDQWHCPGRRRRVNLE